MKKKTQAILRDFERIVGSGSVEQLFSISEMQPFSDKLAAAVHKYAKARQSADMKALLLATSELGERLDKVRTYMGEDNYRAMVELLRR